MQDEKSDQIEKLKNRSDSSSFEIFKEISTEAFIDRYDMTKLLLGIQRHILVILIFLVITTLLAGMFAFTLMNTYKADAVVIYQEDNKPQTLPGGYTLTTLSIATVLDMIKLPVNFLAVKSILGLTLTTNELEAMMDVPTPRANSNLIHIIARGENSNLVVDLVNTLAKVAVKSSQEFYQKQLQAALQSYSEQLETTTQKLAYQLQEIEAFKKENQYFEMTADYSGLLKLMADTKNRLQNTTLQYNSLLVEYENLKREVANLPDEVPVSSSYSSGYHYSPLENHLGSLQQALAEAKSKYTSDNPKVRQIEEELENVARQSKQIGNVNQIYEINIDKTKLQIDLLKMESKVRATLKMKQDLSNYVANLQKELETLPAKQIALSKILYSKEITQEQQKFLTGAIESVQLMLNVPTGSIDVYSLADKARPLRDSWWVQLLPVFGMLFGLAFGILFSVVLEMMDNKFRTAKEIELYYNLPCLGVIPYLPNLTRENLEEKLLFYIRQLSERLELVNHGSTIKSITFTGPIEGEGKSLISYNYALYCKRIGMRVIYIECKPGESTFFQGKPITFLEDYLKGDGSYHTLISHQKIDWIKVGFKDQGMKELIKSERMRSLWTELYLDYDIVVVDAPGVLNEVYAINLVHLSEISVFIVDSSNIGKPLLDQALSNFENFQVKPSGILLNRVLPIYIEDERIINQFKKEKINWLKRLWRS